MLCSVAACAIAPMTAREAIACDLDNSTPGLQSLSCAQDVSTTAPSDHAAEVQAQGAVGTGAVGFNIQAGRGGDGDEISVVVEHGVTLTTDGDGAFGVRADSVGGTGGDAFAPNGAAVGGDGGIGGAISLINAGAILTHGVSATGLFAESFGGQGGQGSSVDINVFTRDGEAGNGGDISISSTGNITTNGAESAGIVALSRGAQAVYSLSGIGGAGGLISISTSGAIASSGPGIVAESRGGFGGANSQGGFGRTGDGGAIEIFATGAITTTEEFATGISALSFGPNVGGTTGDVKVTAGDITTIGSGADGIYAESALGTVTIETLGDIRAGRDAVAAIGRDVILSNYGTLAGNVRLAGDDSVRFENFAGGVFESSAVADLGEGTLTNYGHLSPGGEGHIQTTTILGNFNQATGHLLVDADWATDESDVIAVLGTSELAGQVVVNPLNLSNSGLTKTFVILTATGGVTDNGITAVDTAAVDYEVLFPDANTMSLTATIDFLGAQAAGLTPNQAAAGAALNELVENGGDPDFVSPLLSLGTQGELGAALDQLTPAGDAAQFSSAMKTGSTFAGQLLSCRTLGEGDPNAFIREGQCLWVRANVRQLDNDGRNGETGFDETATFYSAGAQFDLGGPWRFGAGIGFEDGDLRTGSNAQSETERLHLGGVIKYNPGPLLLAASLTGGHGWSDNTRVISFGGFSDVATSESDQSFISGRLTAAYLLSHGHWYAKPQVDLGWTHLERDAYVEQSSGGTALAVGASDDTVFSISPSIEFGAQYALAFGGVARPYVKAGVTWHDADSFVTSAAFQGVPPGTGGFEIVTTIDDVVADLGLGVDFLAESGTVLRVQYDGQFGDQTEQHGGSAKLSVPF